jgi:hypothetical protein
MTPTDEGNSGDAVPVGVPQGLPASKLDASVLDLAYLYAAYANDRVQGIHDAPTFADAVRNAPADRPHQGGITNWCTPTR